MAGIGATVALIKALAPKADPAVIQQAVEDYLEAHPEISVADGSITEEKLRQLFKALVILSEILKQTSAHMIKKLLMILSILLPIQKR